VRPAETPATVVLTLSRVLDGERPSWASREAWEGLRVALGPLLDDARAVVAAEGVRGAGAILGVGTSTVVRARRDGGPLAPK
jgi:hypothetical protein